MASMSYDDKKKKHELAIQQNVEDAKDSSNYCTYSTDISSFDSEVTIYAARKIGRSHSRSGKPCQDYCMNQSVPKGHIFVVSDGVSACIRSDRGSQFACEAAIEAVQKADAATNDENEFTDVLCSLDFRKSIVNLWLGLINKDIAETDGKEQATISDVEMYGATLSLAIMTQNHIVTLNLGDGQILLFNPVDATRVRWHLPKEDSVTAALCTPSCYIDSFIVHVHDRHIYGGILLSSDGIYDTLSNYSGFFSYAKEITDRFEKNSEPLQPFCFNEKRGDTIRPIDLQANITEDDCSIILVVDHHPIPAVVVDMFDTLNKECTIFETQLRTKVLSVYAIEQENGPHLAVIQEGELAQVQKAHKKTESLKLTSAKFLQPISRRQKNNFVVTIYPNTPYFTPDNLFAVGKLKEKAETKYGLYASRLAFQALQLLKECDSELRAKGYCLNNNARSMAFFSKEGLILMPDAISPADKHTNANLLWQMFENQIGVLICGNIGRPVFAYGFNGVGPNYVDPRNPSENLMYLRSGSGNRRFMVNSGKSAWEFSDGTKIQPGTSVLLTDGLSFTLPKDESAEELTVTYKERKSTT